MDASGNKKSPCRIPNQYLKNQKVIKLLELWTLWLIMKKEKKRENSEFKRVVITTLKTSGH